MGRARMPHLGAAVNNLVAVAEEGGAIAGGVGLREQQPLSSVDAPAPVIGITVQQPREGLAAVVLPYQQPSSAWLPAIGAS